AFHSTRLYLHHDTLLPHDHWVWADSAYPLETWCIPPFKKPHNGRLTRDQKSFNYYLSKICVHVEHAFAALKGRFQSLRELRHPVNTQRQHEMALAWIQCCIILHNMIIRFEGIHGASANTMDWAIEEGRELTSQQAEE
ncbi:hypothetical protein M405DRAFT_717601, partial [Rhizopogon salebrosus TDB-379]